MNFNEIKELISIINDCEIAYFEVEKEGIHLKMDKSYNRGVQESRVSNGNEVSHVSNNTIAREVATTDTNNVENEKKQVVDDKNIYEVKSPMVGTFYDSPSADAESYVKVGSKVKKGDVLCIIEAMKLMNEILCEEDGEVVEILGKREQLVEYGEPLFKIRRG